MALAALANACQPLTFSPSVSGAEIVSLQANLVTNYSSYVLAEFRYVQPAVSLQNAEFCNVTITYTHPGQNDTVAVEAWLPTRNWNERLQAVGGGGWTAGRFFLSYATMAGALYDGFAAITTDAGLGSDTSPADWAFVTPGVVNRNLLRNLGYLSLGEESMLAKSLIRSFYGRDPLYSYWNGCSQGGRQGLALAQLYPDAYDGIAAGSPAIYTPQLATSTYWPQQYMKNINQYPYGCELDAISLAAVAYCDALDGVKDGLIFDPYRCDFNPFTVVGQRIDNCAQTNTTMTISLGAAKVAKASWEGINSAKKGRLWHGYHPGSDLTGMLYPTFSSGGVAMTDCTSGKCTGKPSPLAVPWIKYFLAKDANYDTVAMTQAQYENFYQQGIREYSDVLSTTNADLSAFRNAGGKMISFHGLGDQTIPEQGTRDYYDSVSKKLPDVQSFYRYFPVPGLGHCWGGQGGQPTDLFMQLRAWVENGTTPSSTTVSYTSSDGAVFSRKLCPYRKALRYDTTC